MAIDTIKSSAVLDGAIATADIADDAVTSAKIDSTSTGMTLADLTVDTNTLSVDATNNRVGIRTTSPTEALELATDSKFKINSGGDSGNLVLQNGSGTTKFDLGGGSASQNFRFSVTSNTNSYFTFTTNTGEILRISNAGLHIGGTGAANALDDYEEGTWTPTAGTNAGTINTAIGKYTKVGRVVYVVAYIESTGMSTSGSRTYGGLPFAVNNLASQTSVDYQGLEWSNNSGGGIYFDGGTSNFINNVTQTFRGSFAATDNSRFQGFYFTD